jgi:hypothetical protein
MRGGEIILTAEQRGFARTHMAIPGERAAGALDLVFMYRREQAGTHRWLVDDAGVVVETTWFSADDPTRRRPGRRERAPMPPACSI